MAGRRVISLMKAIFSRVWRVVFTFILHVLRTEAARVIAECGKIALDVIQQIQNDPEIVTNEDKRKAAFDEIKKRLEVLGYSVKDSVINLMLELAVQKLKGES